MEKMRIYPTDDYLTIADKIFFNFDVNHSCTVKGFVIDGESVVPKGKMVLEQLEKLDLAENCDKNKRRKRKKPTNSIGDFVSGKIWRWEERIQDGKIVFLIWRMQ